MDVILIFLILLIVISEGCAQYCIKTSNVHGNIYYFCAALLFYSAVAVLLYVCYNYTFIGLVNAIWSGLSVLTIIFIGMYFYHESINAYDLMGIFLIILGIFFIYVFGHVGEEKSKIIM